MRVRFERTGNIHEADATVLNERSYFDYFDYFSSAFALWGFQRAAPFSSDPSCVPKYDGGVPPRRMKIAMSRLADVFCVFLFYSEVFFGSSTPMIDCLMDRRI